MEDIGKEQALRQVYYNPLTGYGSHEQLYRDVREKGVTVSRREVRDWLEHQSAYGRFRPTPKKFKRQQTYVSSIRELAQIDLVDMSALEDENDGYRWILTAIDCFS